MDYKIPKPDIFFVEEIYPALLADVKIRKSPKEKSSDDEDNLLADFINIDYDVTFEFVVYNEVRYRSFFRKFEKVLTSGKIALSKFCYQMVENEYWETNNDEWKEFCKSFELREFIGDFMDVSVDDFSIPTVSCIENSNYYELGEDEKIEEFDYKKLFENYSYKYCARENLGYEDVNEAIREGLMHYFD